MASHGSGSARQSGGLIDRDRLSWRVISYTLGVNPRVSSLSVPALRRSAIALGALALLAVAVATIWSLIASRADQLKQVQSHMRDFNSVLAVQTSRTVAEIDRILRQAEHQIDAADPAPTGESALASALTDLIKSAPQVQALLFIDRSGKLLAHSGLSDPQAARYDASTWLAAHQNSSGKLRFDLSSPTAPGAVAAIELSRVLASERGTVVARVRPGYFENLYRAPELGTDGLVTLMRDDLTELASSATESARQSHGFIDLATAQGTRERTVLRRVDPTTQSARIVALGSVADTPLLIANSVSEHAVLADWRKQLWFIVPSAIVIGSLLLGLTGLLARALREDAQLRDTLKATEQRWRFALEGAGHGVWDWDLASGRTQLSAHHAELLGFPQSAPVEQIPWTELIHPDDLARARIAASELSGGRRSEVSDEIRLRGADGGWRFMLVRGTTLAGGGRFVGTITDVTALREAEQRLKEQEARVTAIVESAMDAIMTVDQQQQIVLFNHAAEKIFGITADQAIGASLDRFIPERYRVAHREHINRFGQTRSTTRRMGQRLTLFGLRADGTEFPIDASISQVQVDEHPYFTVILRDITERVAAEAEIDRSHRELRALSKSANEALEAERRRVARELHDELGQQLSALKLDVNEIEKLAGEQISVQAVTLRAACLRMRNLIDQTVASTRRISTELRPLVLDDLGLGAALDWLIKDFNKRTQIKVTLQVDDDMAEVGEPHASTVFRIVQECLTNVARHANATQVSVLVEAQGDEAHVEVRDNGVGLPPRHEMRAGALGLIGMRERARLLGGQTRAENAPGGGAAISARLPLRPVISDEVLR